jgi:multicomponent Na+:H+ antiporter subunit G
MNAIEILSAVLLGAGALLMLVAAIGLLRFPDLFLRMSATTKAATLGMLLFMSALVVAFRDPGVATRATAIVIFTFLTLPVPAHLLGRAAYFMGVPLWKGTRVDELRGKYDPRTHALDSESARGNAND